MPHSDQPPVSPTQADRLIAWDHRPHAYVAADYDPWMSGRYDNIKVIQAFARHRLSAIALCGVDQETIARAICIAMGDDPEREGPFGKWFKKSPYGAAADAILSLIARAHQEDNRNV